MTTVINIRTLEKRNGFYQLPPDHIYIGRWNTQLPVNSDWSNPFVIGKDGTRAEVVDKYAAKMWAATGMVERIRRELKGKVLVCWCKPEACHGDWLARVADGRVGF